MTFEQGLEIWPIREPSPFFSIKINLTNYYSEETRGQWCCYTGYFNTGLFAYGKTPKDAYDNFIKKFNGEDNG